MYDETAESYARMMDTEIALPVYADVLARLRQRITKTTGAVVDTACGSGHMLCMYYERYDKEHPLLGVDLSAHMISIAKEKLAPNARCVVGDMRDLPVESGSSSAVLNFFALHHLDSEAVQQAFREWYRVLGPRGQLVVATWEGHGAIDYGDASDIVALRYSCSEMNAWAQAAGFSIARCFVEPVEDFPMDAVYLEASKDELTTP
jgi:ubiquinone/menaquinone biosynthesis C-methylase UbiE